MGKINKNSKRQLKLKIKELQGDKNTLWKMVERRNEKLQEIGVVVGIKEDEFLIGNEEALIPRLKNSSHIGGLICHEEPLTNSHHLKKEGEV